MYMYLIVLSAESVNNVVYNSINWRESHASLLVMRCLLLLLGQQDNYKEQLELLRSYASVPPHKIESCGCWCAGVSFLR